MADLRSLFPTSQIQGGAASRLQVVYVFNTSVSTAQNGGRCCLFTVPTDATWATFEVWGGGSDGPGSCCCQQPSQSGGAGAYGRRTISVTPGAQYTICAAGSGCCSFTCCGTEGFPSFVQISGGGAMIVCAQGGPPSCSRCFTAYDSGCAIISNSLIRCGSVFCADFGICAISGASGGGSCGFNYAQYVPEGPILGGGAKHSRDMCIILSGCNHIGGVATFPGGGGAGAVTSGGCCWGGHGAGGLVIITYR